MPEPIRGSEEGPPLPHLCETCRVIDFKSFFIKTKDAHVSQEPEEQAKEIAKLGYLEDIISRSSKCEFCSLLISCARRLNDGKDPPTSQGRNRVEVELDQQFLCTVGPLDWEGQQVQKLDVSRLIVNFEPAIFGFFSKIRFQIHKEDNDIPGFGRLMSSSIDSEQLKSWLHTCQEHHGADCHAPEWFGEPSQPTFLKVIDVEKHCVVAAPPDCRYVALSYVWGDLKEMGSQRWLMKTANVDESRLNNGLDLDLLPRTITDAMALVSQIGERYLWVDALCIVQDDFKELAEQTSQMDLIYACALATIIMATGASAEAGMPGVKIPRPISQTKINIGNGYHLMETVAQGNSSHLQHSVWNSRGWTFQERLLSRRALIVTPEQVYWECEHQVLNEETHLETGTSLWVLPQAMDCNDEWDDRPTKFSRDALSGYVTRYSTRQFTYQNDVLAAFSGILRRMEYRNNQKFHWALPYDLFDQALTWRYGKRRREELCRLIVEDESYQIGFPSWSWLGWTGFIGGVIFNDELDNERIAGRGRSEIDFYRLYADGHVEPIIDTTQRSLRASHDISPDAEDSPKPKSLRQGADSSQSHQWKKPVPAEIKFSIRVPEPIIKLPGHVDLARVDTGRLVFWTSHAQLQVHAAEHDEMRVKIAGSQIKISITNGIAEREFNRRVRAEIGQAKDIEENEGVAQKIISTHLVKERVDEATVPDLTWEKSEDSDSNHSLDGINVSSADAGESVVGNDSNDYERVTSSEKVPVLMDFVVISRYWPVGMPQYDKEESLNCLIVAFSETEPEVARRIGSAIIVEKDWINADREWKRIMLE
ncbi:hypothetical protein ONS96_012994 [Cadophora gregata f. sp. sojae]|nr:hypothetical protein ONS96_012994 [Cadophora gregata f. sp. sojae]